MKIKPPKPKKYDIVELLDCSKTLGTVKQIIGNNKALIDWGNEEVSIEFIKDLALVFRNNFVSK